MNKGGSHVEIIISFIIFITFVLFLLSILGPSISTQKDKKNIFDDVERGIINRVSSNMTITTLNLEDGGAACVNLDNIISDLGIGDNIIIKDSSGGNVNSRADGNSLQITRASTEDKFFKIYSSEEFDGLQTGTGCSAINYNLGLTKTSKYIFEKELLSLMSRDYATLKIEMKIPAGVEF
jgi:hypothetical protein